MDVLFWIYLYAYSGVLSYLEIDFPRYLSWILFCLIVSREYLYGLTPSVLLLFAITHLIQHFIFVRHTSIF